MLRLNPQPSTPPLSPSQIIRDVTVQLLGLSFGEHDGGAQRACQTNRLSRVLSLWASGLLAADHPPAQLNAVVLAFESLIHSPSAFNLLVWSNISADTIDTLIATHCTRATAILNEIPGQNDNTSEDDGSNQHPARRAIRALNVAQHLLSATTKIRRPALGAALGPLVACTARLRLTAALFPSSLTHEDLETISAILSQVAAVQEHANEQSLFSVSLISTLRALKPSISLTISQSSPSVDAFTAPVAATIYTILQAVSDSARRKNATSVTPFVAQLCEHCDTGTRVPALSALEMIYNGLPSHETGRLVPVLRASLLWRDAESTVHAVPMLRDALMMDCRGGLHDRVPTVLTEILELLRHHVDKVVQNSDDDGAQGALHAMIVCADVTTSAGSVLVICAGDIVARVSGILPRAAAAMVARPAGLDNEDFRRLTTAVAKMVNLTWIRARAYRAAVFAGCVGAVCAVRDSEERQAVCEAVREIIDVLGAACGPQWVNGMTKTGNLLAQKYTSVSGLGTLFDCIKGPPQGHMPQLGCLVPHFYRGYNSD